MKNHLLCILLAVAVTSCEGGSRSYRDLFEACERTRQMVIMKDAETGCEYLGITGASMQLQPRLDPAGKHICRP